MNNPLVFQPEEYQEFSIIFDIKIEDAINETLVFLISEFQAEYRTDINIVYSNENLTSIFYRDAHNNLYVFDRKRDYYEIKHNVKIMSIVYYLRTNKEQLIPKMIRHIGDYYDMVDRVSDNIQEYQREINSLYRKVYNFVSSSNILLDTSKIAKLLKSKFRIDFEDISDENNDKYKFTFNNITLTSPVEGSLRYKKIEVVHCVDNSTNNISMSICFHFPNGFSSGFLSPGIHWGINFHPHVSTRGTICYGNQREIVKELIRKRPKSWIEFYAAIMYEVLTTYNPDGPYRSLSGIGSDLRKIEGLWGKFSKYTNAEKQNYIYSILSQGTYSGVPAEEAQDLRSNGIPNSTDENTAVLNVGYIDEEDGTINELPETEENLV